MLWHASKCMGNCVATWLRATCCRHFDKLIGIHSGWWDYAARHMLPKQWLSGFPNYYQTVTGSSLKKGYDKVMYTIIKWVLWSRYVLLGCIKQKHSHFSNDERNLQIFHTLHKHNITYSSLHLHSSWSGKIHGWIYRRSLPYFEWQRMWWVAYALH